MEKNEIAALIEALCERPLEDGQEVPTEALQAFCSEAAKALSRAGDTPAGAGLGTFTDVDRLTAALATLLSGADSDAARRTVEEAMLSSPAARLDAEAALAFIDAIERSPQTAPADLVEDMLAADAAAGAGSAPPRQAGGRSSVWSAIAGKSWSARRWRMAAACAVLLVVAVGSWSAFWQQTDPTEDGLAVPVVKTSGEQQPVADAPAPPRPALATAQPCEPLSRASESVNAERALAEPPKAGSAPSLDCSTTPDHQFADRPANEEEAIAARRQADAARRAARARAAASAASRAGAAQADREPGQGPVQADQSRPMFGSANVSHPAATMSAPAAAPAMRPAAPGIR